MIPKGATGASVLVGLEAGVQSRHIAGVSREDESGQALRDHREVGLDHIGGFGFGEPAPDSYRFVERVNVEVADRSG